MQPTASPQTATAFFYLGVLLTLLNVIDKIVVWWRGGQAPILKSIAELETRMVDRVDRIERDVTRQVTEVREHVDEQVDSLNNHITQQLNGWSGRINDNREEIDRNSKAIEELARHHIEFKSESKADRGHLTTRLVGVEAKVDGAVTAQTQMELRLVHALGESERRLMAAIRLAGSNGNKP